MTNPAAVVVLADAAATAASEVAEHLDKNEPLTGEVTQKFVASLVKPGRRVAITLGGRVLVADVDNFTLTIESSDGIFFARNGIASRITMKPLREKNITDFEPGLVLILGRTGAGKSVILNEIAKRRSDVALCQLDEEDNVADLDVIQVQSPFAIVATILGLAKIGKRTILIDSLRTLAFAKGVQGKGGFNQELFSTLSGLNRLSRALDIELLVTLNPRTQDETMLQAVLDAALSSVDTLLINRHNEEITAEFWLRAKRLDRPNFVFTLGDLRQSAIEDVIPEESDTDTQEGTRLDFLELSTRQFASRVKVGF